MKIRSIGFAAVILGTCLAITGCRDDDFPVTPGSGTSANDTAPVTQAPGATAPVTAPPANTPPVAVVPPATVPVTPSPTPQPSPQPPTGSATLSWTPPTANVDGSGLTNLAGYTIYFGSDPNSLGQSVQITNPGLTMYVLGNLSAGTTYFAMTSYNSAGVESARSTVGSKTI